MNNGNKRKNNQIRPIRIQRKFTKYAPGSVLISMGETKVLCSATIEESVPRFLKDSGRGWVTAEYAMLPSATHTRNHRNIMRPSGRTNEIQRLIGRSLRAIVDLELLGERSIYIDCDVIQADGGTRTASINGGMVALWDAIQNLLADQKIRVNPIRELLSAVSVGILDGEVIVDLNYEQDSTAQVDMNVVMTDSGRYVEIQGTAEGQPFSEDQAQLMLAGARTGIQAVLEQVKPLMAAKQVHA